ncbi:MAG: 2-oxoacid:acceptor oxidoreductase subunit alpha [Planctomycetota bacterium]
MTESKKTALDVPLEQQETVVIRFAGDSGDGMQLTGSQFTTTSAVVGNDLATFPDFPAEIRAPAGTRPGVSGFQIHFSAIDIHTPGDAPDVLVALNPAALIVNLGDLKPGGMIIANSGNFTARNLKKAHLDSNPLEDGSLDGYRVISIDINARVAEALKDSPLSAAEIQRCKNFYVLGLMYWLYSRPVEPTARWLQTTFAKRPELAVANEKAMRSGYNAGNIHELFQGRYEVPACAEMPPGRYRNIMGNQALGLGLVAGAQCAGRKLFLGAYPITPATDILQQLAAYKHHDVITFMAEDEIAAICAALGASFAGHLGATSTSGPGVALKTEALGLAVMTELPLVLVNVQRAGPSTGMPTKVEQADLLQAIFGRNGEAPIPVLACASPTDAFDCAIEACRIAVERMTPVILLSDNYIANGSEPWRLPDLDELPDFRVPFRTDPKDFQPYLRKEKLARPWAIPGTPGLEHRIGGLEKQDRTGNVSYDPANHEAMVRLRARKVMSLAEEFPLPTVYGSESGDLLVVSWGGTSGAVRSAAEILRRDGFPVANATFRHLWPFPQGLDDLLSRYQTILVPEMNTGQLYRVLRSEFPARNFLSYTKVQGKPFHTSQIVERVQSILEHRP